MLSFSIFVYPRVLLETGLVGIEVFAFVKSAIFASNNAIAGFTIEVWESVNAQEKKIRAEWVR